MFFCDLESDGTCYEMVDELSCDYMISVSFICTVVTHLSAFLVSSHMNWATLSGKKLWHLDRTLSYWSGWQLKAYVIIIFSNFVDLVLQELGFIISL